MNKEPGRHRPAAHIPVSRDLREIIFVTCAAKDRKAILARPEVHAMLREAWQSADAWLVGRYVIMPDHVHFFCARGTGTHPLEAWMQYWKSLITRAWPNPGEKPIWQRGHWDTRLRRGENYSAKWDYVRENPVRAGLCMDPETWPYQGELDLLPW
jgi:putative transposase